MDKIWNTTLSIKLKTEPIEHIIGQYQLRWFRDVSRMDKDNQKRRQLKRKRRVGQEGHEHRR